MRTLWCSNHGCRAGYASVAGDVPLVCPACDKTTVWNTCAPPDNPRAVFPYELTYNDRQLLTRHHRFLWLSANVANPDA